MSDQSLEHGPDEPASELRDSTPNAAGPDRAAGGMGVSSERVGATGGGSEATDGERDTTAPRRLDRAGDHVGSKADFEQGEEENPVGIDPRAGYPSLDPRSKERPYKDA